MRKPKVSHAFSPLMWLPQYNPAHHQPVFRVEVPQKVLDRIDRKYARIEEKKQAALTAKE